MSTNILLEKYQTAYAAGAVELWNSIVRAGRAFPQDELLTLESGEEFFQSQTATVLAVEKSSLQVVGLYILHPNNVGRCGHICNASYAVAEGFRGRRIGEMLVKDCMQQARAAGYKILQFNAVVASNKTALNLYKKLGFTQLGLIPGGFRNIDNVYEDIIPHYITL